ncbi:CHC2 zinc finger domain-containing protein [Streptomyces sp. NPDC055036]
MNTAGTPASKPPIGKVLAHYYGLEVKAARGRQKVCCPLHADSNPSASVNVDTDRWNCFVCNLSEDSYAVIMRERECGFTDAKEFARDEFGGDSEDVPPDVPGQSGRTVRSRSGPRGSGKQVRPGIRRFGDAWS